jgi:hypothetical protein
MADLDPALRQVVVGVHPDQLPGLLGHLGIYAADYDITLNVDTADPTHTEPFIAVTPTIPDFSTIFPENAELAEHVARTLPTTLSGYAGKEHFCAWGLNVEDPLRRQQTGRLFTEVAFPFVGIPTTEDGRRSSKKVPRDEVGIVVANRRDLRIKKPPAEISGDSRSIGVELHIDSPESPGFVKRAVRETVVQMRGVVALGRNPEMADRILSPGSRDALVAIMPQLVLLPDVEQ